MKTKLWFTLAACAAAAAAAPAQQLTPGLWEASTTMKSSGGGMDDMQAKMQAQLAAMPPDKRAMVEQMMAGKGVGIGANGTTARVCLTAEQIARGEMPHDANCTQQRSPRSGNTVHFSFQCSGKFSATGEGDFTIVSDKSYQSHMSADTTVRGQPAHMDMTSSGRWVASDCGDVKPRP